MSRTQLFAGFFFLVFAFLLYQVYLVFGAFLSAAVWAAILALVFEPTFEWVNARLRNSTAASALLTFAIYLMVVIPSLILGLLLLGQLRGFYGSLQENFSAEQTSVWVERARTKELAGISFDRILADLPEPISKEIDLRQISLRAARGATETVAVGVGGILRNLLQVTISFFLTMLILFFFLRDGRELFASLRDAIPMERDEKDFIFERLHDTIAAVVQSMVVTALAQGILCGLAFFALGVPFALLLGVTAGIASFIPFGGPAFVWIPAVAYLSFVGAWGKAIALLVWGVLVVGLVDNLLKPWILGDRTRLPTLFLFLALIGGLQAYGVLGVFLGPALLATFVAFLEIYRGRYRLMRDATGEIVLEKCDTQKV